MPHRPNPLWMRLLALPPAFGLAYLVAPLPTLAVPMFATDIVQGSAGASPLLFLPILAVFTALFAGPFALPVMLWMAVRNVRSVGAQVAGGLLSSVPAMVLFAATMEGLTGPIIGAILGGGALGGLTVSAVRDGVERHLSGNGLPGEAAPLPPGVPTALPSPRQTL